MHRLSLTLCCLLALLVLSRGQTIEHTQVTLERTARSSSCSIEMVGRAATRRREAMITARVVCDERTLYDQKLSLSELDETPLDHVCARNAWSVALAMLEMLQGIRLFAETSLGMAYVHIGEESDANLESSLFMRLPEFGSAEMAAPLVLTDARLDMTNVTFVRNEGGYRSGAMIVSGTSNVELFEVSTT